MGGNKEGMSHPSHDECDVPLCDANRSIDLPIGSPVYNSQAADCALRPRCTFLARGAMGKANSRVETYG